MDRQADLLEIVTAAHSPIRFPRGLHRWQQQTDEDANDGDDNEQLN